MVFREGESFFKQGTNGDIPRLQKLSGDEKGTIPGRPLFQGGEGDGTFNGFVLSTSVHSTLLSSYCVDHCVLVAYTGIIHASRIEAGGALMPVICHRSLFETI